MKIPNTNIDLELKQGDIAAQNDMEAVVNAANAQLTTGGGVAGAIHRAAGPELSEACQPMAPIRPGEAVISGAFNLPNDYVIHCLGPIYGRDKPEDQLLANCYENALHLADKNNISSIAFPAISSGAFGYPIDSAAEVALGTISDVAKELKHVKLIRMVLFSNRDLEIFENKLKQLI
ncbi:MAG: macro domain-containing protein [Chitinophagales bacterium]